MKRDLLNVTTYYVKSETRIAEQASICVYKACTFILNFLSFRKIRPLFIDWYRL